MTPPQDTAILYAQFFPGEIRLKSFICTLTWPAMLYALNYMEKSDLVPPPCVAIKSSIVHTFSVGTGVVCGAIGKSSQLSASVLLCSVPGLYSIVYLHAARVNAQR